MHCFHFDSGNPSRGHRAAASLLTDPAPLPQLQWLPQSIFGPVPFVSEPRELGNFAEHGEPSLASSDVVAVAVKQRGLFLSGLATP